MRIAFIVDEFPVITETFILNQITGLIDLGHQVEIFAGSQPRKAEFHSDIEKYELLKHVHYFSEKPRNRFVRLSQGFLLFLRYFFKHKSLILRSLNFFKYGKEALSLNYYYKTILFTGFRNFDILQCHFGHNGNLAAIFKEIGIKGKVVTMFHGYDVRRGIEKGGHIYQKLFERGDCFLSISSYNYQNLVAFGADPKKIVFHPVGIDLERFPIKEIRKNGHKAKRIVIVSVGRLVKEKGFFYGIKSIDKLVHSMGAENIEYQIVGDGALMGDLVKLVNKLKLSDKIRFLGSQNHQNIAKIMNRADIYFLPSTAEALPVALMEAQATGLPVVATDVGSVSQAMIDGLSGYLVQAGNIDDMAQKLKHLSDNPDKWEKIGMAGRRYIEENYDIKKMNQKLSVLYDSLINGSFVS